MYYGPAIVSNMETVETSSDLTLVAIFLPLTCCLILIAAIILFVVFKQRSNDYDDDVDYNDVNNGSINASPVYGNVGQAVNTNVYATNAYQGDTQPIANVYAANDYQELGLNNNVTQGQYQGFDAQYQGLALSTNESQTSSYQDLAIMPSQNTAVVKVSVYDRVSCVVFFEIQFYFFKKTKTKILLLKLAISR